MFVMVSMVGQVLGESTSENCEGDKTSQLKKELY